MTKYFNTRAAGEKNFDRDTPRGHLTWHWAEKGGRMYRCTCMAGFRIGGRVVFANRGTSKLRGRVASKFRRWRG